MDSFFQRHTVNNSIPIIKDRILRILGAAEGRRLKRWQLTHKLGNMGSTRNEKRVAALLELAATGKIRCEKYSHGRGHGEMWALVDTAGSTTES